MKPARKTSLRGRLALGLNGLAMSLGGFTGGRSGYEAGRPSTKRTRGWQPGAGGPAADTLPGLEDLRGRSRDLDRNNAITHGAASTKVNGAIGAGLKLRPMLDRKVLGLSDEQAVALQYQLEFEWEIFEREADFTGQMHLRDMERVAFRSALVSGDVGVVRRYRKRPGETYGTRVLLIEADRISNPNRRADTALLQGGVELSADGELVACHVSDRHPGEMTTAGLRWERIPLRGPASGLRQFLLAAQVERPGQVRGVPLFAAVMEDLKQLGSYDAAELKAALNDAFLFAFEETPTETDDEGNAIVTRSDGETDAAGELTLDDLTITSLAPGSKVNVKKPERPNSGYGAFVEAVLQKVGAGLDIPYEVLVKRFNSSFSASRGALEVAYKAAMIEQDWFVRQILDPVREWQFTEMVASGRFNAPGFFSDPIKRAAWLGRMWIGPTRVQINPQVEANADDTDLKNAVKTREQIQTERTGGDFDTKSAQWNRENAIVGTPGAVAKTPTDPTQGNGPDATQKTGQK